MIHDDLRVDLSFEAERVVEHQELIGLVQDALGPLVEAETSGFENSYLIAAYEQRFEVPLIKVYLRRTTRAG